MNVKDFARQEGVTTQAIYKLLKTHAAALEGHVLVGKKGRDLDACAQEYLQERMVGNTVVVADRRLEDEVAALKQQLQDVQNELILKNQALINAQNQLLKIEEKNKEDIKAAEDKLSLKLGTKHREDVEKAREEERRKFKKTLFGLYRKFEN